MDSMNLGSLKVGVGADLSALAAGFAQANEMVAKFASGAGRQAADLGKQFAPAAAQVRQVEQASQAAAQAIAQVSGPAQKAAAEIAKIERAHAKVAVEARKWVQEELKGSAEVAAASATFAADLAEISAAHVAAGKAAQAQAAQEVKGAEEAAAAVRAVGAAHETANKHAHGETVEMLSQMRIGREMRHVLGIQEAVSVAQRVGEGLNKAGEITGSASIRKAGEATNAVAEIGMAGAVAGPIAALMAAIGVPIQALVKHFGEAAEASRELAEEMDKAHKEIGDAAQASVAPMQAAQRSWAAFLSSQAHGTSPELEANDRAMGDKSRELRGAMEDEARWEKIFKPLEAIMATKAIHPVSGRVTVHRPGSAVDEDAVNYEGQFKEAEEKLQEARLRKIQANNATAEIASQGNVILAQQLEAKARRDLAQRIADIHLEASRAGTPDALLKAATLTHAAVLGATGPSTALGKNRLATEELRNPLPQQLFEGQQAAGAKFLEEAQRSVSELMEHATQSGKPAAEAFTEVNRALQLLRDQANTFLEGVASKSGAVSPSLSREVNRGVELMSKSADSSEGSAILADVARQVEAVNRLAGVMPQTAEALQRNITALEALRQTIAGSSILTGEQKRAQGVGLDQNELALLGRRLAEIQTEAQKHQLPVEGAHAVMAAHQDMAIYAAAQKQAEQALAAVGPHLTAQPDQLQATQEVINAHHALAEATKGVQTQLVGLQSHLQSMGDQLGDIGTGVLAKFGINLKPLLAALESTGKGSGSSDSGSSGQGMAGGVAQAGQSGGWIAALIALVAELVMSSRQFKAIMGPVNRQLQMLGDAFGHVLDDLYPLISFGKYIAQAIGGLFNSLSRLGDIGGVMMRVAFEAGKYITVAIMGIMLGLDYVANAFIQAAAFIRELFGDAAGARAMRRQETDVNAQQVAIQKVLASNFDDLNKQASSAANSLGDVSAGLNAVTGYLVQQTYYDQYRPEHHAAGGTVWGPTLSWVGEGGEPEDIVPHSKRAQYREHLGAGSSGHASAGADSLSMVVQVAGDLVLQGVQDAKTLAGALLGKHDNELAFAGSPFAAGPRFLGSK